METLIRSIHLRVMLDQILILKTAYKYNIAIFYYIIVKDNWNTPNSPRRNHVNRLRYIQSLNIRLFLASIKYWPDYRAFSTQGHRAATRVVIEYKPGCFCQIGYFGCCLENVYGSLCLPWRVWYYYLLYRSHENVQCAIHPSSMSPCYSV